MGKSEDFIRSKDTIGYQLNLHIPVVGVVPASEEQAKWSGLVACLGSSKGSVTHWGQDLADLEYNKLSLDGCSLTPHLKQEQCMHTHTHTRK